jgi:hypothetical protein
MIEDYGRKLGVIEFELASLTLLIKKVGTRLITQTLLSYQYRKLMNYYASNAKYVY